MNKTLATLTLLVATACVTADRPPASAVRELAPTGKLRAAINFGNPVLARKEPLGGVSVDLSRELARRLGVPLELVPYEAAGKVTDDATKDAWDVAFVARDPKRAENIEFTAPYVIIEGGYMVPAGSPLYRIEDVDRDGVRIAVSRGSAYDLFLSRTLKHASLVRAPSPPASIELFMKERLEALAGVKQPLVGLAKAHPELRVLEGRFMVIEQAMATPRPRPDGAEYLRGFVDEMKASGFVATSLEKNGQKDAAVAP